MTLRIDPEQNEIRALESLTDWRRKRVLEIGCGQGRLSRRIAELGAVVDASDTDSKVIEKARAGLPMRLRKRIRFHAGRAESLNAPDGSYDVVVFAWSL